MQIDVVKTITEVVASASLLHTLLPPWEAFDDFPGVQKYYKVLIYFVGYVALNGRSSVPWNKAISINNPNGVNTTGVSKTTVSVPVDVVTETEVKPNDGQTPTAGGK